MWWNIRGRNMGEEFIYLRGRLHVGVHRLFSFLRSGPVSWKGNNPGLVPWPVLLDWKSGTELGIRHLQRPRRWALTGGGVWGRRLLCLGCPCDRENGCWSLGSGVLRCLTSCAWTVALGFNVRRSFYTSKLFPSGLEARSCPCRDSLPSLPLGIGAIATARTRSAPLQWANGLWERLGIPLQPAAARRKHPPAKVPAKRRNSFPPPPRGKMSAPCLQAGGGDWI